MVTEAIHTYTQVQRQWADNAYVSSRNWYTMLGLYIEYDHRQILPVYTRT